jgi:sigma-B regulation protein RsbU (phosphoserine phosphatase)
VPSRRPGLDDLPDTGGFWREALADVSDAVILQDAEGQVRWCNPAALAWFPSLDGGGWIEPGQVAVLSLDSSDEGYVEYCGVRFPARCRTVQDGWRIWTCSPSEEKPPDDRQGIEGFLAEAGVRLTGVWDRALAAGVIAELAAAELADFAYVVLPTTRGRWEWWSSGSPSGVAKGRVRRVLPELAPVLSQTMSGTGPVRARPLPHDEVLNLPSAFAASLGPCVHVSVVSLIAEGGDGPAGAIVLGTEDDSLAFGAGQDVAVTEFARRASAALSSAYHFERQRDAIDGLKTTLGPTELPAVPGSRLAVWYEPAKGALDIGGDFYDVHPRADGSALVVLGDICGNGAEAAALTGRVRHSLAALHLVERNGKRLLHRLNEILIAAGSSRFATLIVGSMAALDDGGLRLTLTSGGHPAPLVLRKSGEVEELALQGMLIGVSSQAQFADCVVELAEGDICLIYTDGISEARGDHDRSELYGQERLSQVLSECVGLPAHLVVKRVRGAVHEWLGETEHDDMALLAIQCAEA